MLIEQIHKIHLNAIQSYSKLEKILIVSGDGDFTQLVRTLTEDGTTVQIWCFREAMSRTFIDIVGQGNIVHLDDIL